MRASTWRPSAALNPPRTSVLNMLESNSASSGEQGRAPLVADGLAVVAVALAALTGVVIFLPAQGFVATPLRDGLGFLLGRVTFALPVLLLLGGVVRLAHGPLPRAQLVGLALLLIGVLVGEHQLNAGDAGLAGRWLATLLMDALGGVAPVLLVLADLVVGACLTFGVRLGRR
jgi:hypothetical protein